MNKEEHLFRNNVKDLHLSTLSLKKNLTDLKSLNSRVFICTVSIFSPQHTPKKTKTPDRNPLSAHILLSRHLISGFHVYEYEILIHANKTAESVRQRFGREAGCYN